jgi:hypothetical protein
MPHGADNAVKGGRCADPLTCAALCGRLKSVGNEGRQFVGREAPVQHACCASTKGWAKKKEAAI